MKLSRAGFVALASVLAVATVHAQDAVHAEIGSTDARFDRGAWEFEDMVGAFFLFDRGGNDRVTIDNAINSARLGVMVYNPAGPGFLRGNFEVLGELFGGPIFHGPGDVVAGLSILFRYNFVQPGARIVPYFQAGGGGVYSDIAEGAASSNAVSQSLNFNLQATGGLRFLLNSAWSINAEVGYRHISNAGLSDPNYGIDQLGGALGFGFSF